jgi:class 3 adenylate cyclase/predicted ATPase
LPLAQGAAVGTLMSSPPAVPTPPTAERRLVSVLFADLVGFTALSEHRDPEETRELLSRYFDRAREIIDRYGGTVEKFIGDAVMAVWGAPVAHEDDAERAVRAGLELVDAIATLEKDMGAGNLRLRAGVFTGEAAVTLAAQGQGMVAGDLVNTASRLQAIAAPGTVLVGETTYRAARQAIAFEEAGEQALKGKNLPVVAYRALRVVAGHGGFRRAETIEAPFVGRDDEIRLLKDALHTTGREHRPRLVSVMGIGGIGKSRLAWEFFKYIDGLVETIYWHQGRCPAYGEGVTFWALGEMVRMRARITETEDATSARNKLAKTVEQHVTDPKERHWILPRLAHLLGFDDGTSGEREELFAAWRTFFERIAAGSTTVLVFEDMQWADPGLMDFIEHVLEWARSSPILVVTLSRPELMERRPTWGAGQRNFISVHLAPLADDEMRKLLGGLAVGLPDFLVEQVVERSEGVPLYAVEMVRMLVDQGHLAQEDGAYMLVSPPDRLDVPDTLHALIASRLDTLEPDDRELLQDASVLGKTFTLAALAAIRNEDLRSLQGKLQGLVRRELLIVEGDPWSPERGQYGFVQSIIREVAYATLARPERRSRHLAAASYFEAMGDELASVVAAHLIEAQSASPIGEEADELVSRATAALDSAADRASSLGAHSQALDYLEKALDICDEAPDQAVLLEKAADSAEKAGLHEVAKRYASQSIEAYRRVGDRLGEARAGALYGSSLVMGGRPGNAIKEMEGILSRVAQSQVEEDVVRLLARIAAAHMMASDPEPAIAHADKALAGAERLGDTRLVIEALHAKANALHLSGRWLEATVLLRGAVTLGEKHGLSDEQALASLSLSNALLLTSPAEALEATLASVSLAQTLGLRVVESIALVNAGEAAVSTGEWDLVQTSITELDTERLSDFDRSIVELTESRLRALRGESSTAKTLRHRAAPAIEAADSPQDLANLRETSAIAAMTENRLDDAIRAAREAVAADPRSGYGIRSYLIAARAALWLEESSVAEKELMRLRDRGLHGPWLTWNREALEAGLLAFQGRADEAAHLYQRSAQELTGLRCPFDCALVQLDFITLLPDHPDAPAGAHEARQIFEGLGAEPFLRRLEAAVSSSASRP